MIHTRLLHALLILIALSTLGGVALAAENTRPEDRPARAQPSPKEAPSPLTEKDVMRHWSQTSANLNRAPEGRHYVLFENHTFYLEEHLNCQEKGGTEETRWMIDATGHWALTPTGITLTIEARRVAGRATCECHQNIPRVPCYYELEDVVTEEKVSQHHATFTDERHPDAPYESSPTLNIDGELFFGGGTYNLNAESLFNGNNTQLPDAYVEALGCRQVTYEPEGEEAFVRIWCGEDAPKTP